jgi:threonine synthase
VEARTAFASLAVGDPSHGDLAIGAARATGGGIVAVPEDVIEENTALLGELTGIEADCASGAALGALVQAAARGEVASGARVVLIVTGGKPQAAQSDVARVTTVAADADAVLSALGLRS